MSRQECSLAWTISILTQPFPTAFCIQHKHWIFTGRRRNTAFTRLSEIVTEVAFAYAHKWSHH